MPRQKRGRYLFPCPGLVTTCSTGNNGNVRAQSIAFSGFSSTQAYVYDNLSRLQTATESGTGTWSEGYQYSNVGNMWYGARSGLPALTVESPQSSSWFLASNRINGWTTGDSGNLESQGALARSFVYDAENRQISATVNGAVSTYIYDGEGQRVQKTAGGVTTTYVYDISGELVAEYSSEPVAALCSTALCYVTADHLGSTRVVTDNGGNVDRRYDYTPFGTELLAGTGGRTTAMGYRTAPDGFGPKFTGQMWDVETGLYYYGARYYSPAQGRFTGVDPENAGAIVGDSQSWNGYAYVGNNPLNYTDPTGEGIFGTIGTIVGGFFGPWGALIGGLAGNAADASIWGPSSVGLAGLSVGSLTRCGGPLENCGGLGGGGWNERSPVGPSVQNPGRFVLSLTVKGLVDGDSVSGRPASCQFRCFEGIKVRENSLTIQDHVEIAGV